MLTIHVWPKRLKDFLLTHPLYKSPEKFRLPRRSAGNFGIIRARQFKIFSVLRYRWTQLKPGKFYMSVRDARNAPAMGAFPFVRLIGFSRASTDSRTGTVPSSFPARAPKVQGGIEEAKRWQMQ